MRERLVSLVLLAPLAGALLVACAANAHPDNELARTNPVQAIAIELRDVGYDRQRIELALDKIVEIELSNVGSLDHDFTVEQMGVDAIVIGEQTSEHQGHGASRAVHAATGPGTSVKLRLHTHAPGEFTYYCTVAGHREAGMTGTIVVS